MTTLVHIGDLHIPKKASARENKRMRGVAGWLLHRYRNAATKPVLLFTGDIADNGLAAEFDRFLGHVRPLRDAGFRFAVAPGNHDVGDRGVAFEPKAQNNFQRQLVGELMGVERARTTESRMAELFPLVTELDDCLLVGVDTAHTSTYVGRGQVGAGQLEKLDAILNAATKPVVVYHHHHPFTRVHWLALEDWRALLACVNRDTVDVLMFGHRHLAKTWNRHGTYDRIKLIVAAGKTTKPARRARSLLEVREVTVGEGPPKTSLYRFAPHRFA